MNSDRWREKTPSLNKRIDALETQAGTVFGTPRFMPCGEFKPSKTVPGRCESCGWLEHDHKSADQLQKEWLESTEPPRRGMETPAAWMRARDLVYEESVNLADAVPLSDFRSVVNYAKWLESKCEQYRLQACEHLTTDDDGKPVCGLILNGVGVE